MDENVTNFIEKAEQEAYSYSIALQKKDERINDLQNLVYTLSGERNHELQQLSAELREANAQIDKATKDNEELTIQLNNQGKLLKEKCELEMELNKQILQLKYTNSESRSEISLLKLQQNEDESKIHRRRKTTASLKPKDSLNPTYLSHESQDLTEVLNILKLEKETYQEQMVRIKNQAVDALMEKEKEINSLKSTIHDYQRQTEALYEKLSFYSEQQSQSKDKSHNASFELTQVRYQMDEIQSAHENERARLIAQIHEISDAMELQKKEFQRTIYELHTQYSTGLLENSKSLSLESHLAIMEKREKDLTKALKDKTDLIASMKEETKALKNKIDNLHSFKDKCVVLEQKLELKESMGRFSLENKDEELREMRKNNNELQKQIDGLTYDTSKKAQEIESLDIDRNRLQKTVTSLENKFQKIINTYSERVSELEKRIQKNEILEEKANTINHQGSLQEEIPELINEGSPNKFTNYNWNSKEKIEEEAINDEDEDCHSDSHSSKHDSKIKVEYSEMKGLYEGEIEKMHNLLIAQSNLTAEIQDRNRSLSKEKEYLEQYIVSKSVNWAEENNFLREEIKEAEKVIEDLRQLLSVAQQERDFYHQVSIKLKGFVKEKSGFSFLRR